MVAKSDIAIAQAAQMMPICAVAADRLGIAETALEPYGAFKAKIGLDYLRTLEDRPLGRLVLVTAINPTPAGEGKTTTSIGLGDALNRLGKRSITCLREPSLGPCFGMKGGAAGGGHAQVVPMEDINLHFTGDFHAIGAANNLLAAMVDNHIYWRFEPRIDPRRVSWRRVVDMNDRALRSIVSSLGGVANGFAREDGFDITVASEVMAIFCLARDLDDLKARLARIVVGYTPEREPVTAGDLKAAGAMAALLKDAIKPNLVQTLENNPVFIHGGPFANIAHGCNSLIATRAALRLAEIVVTEAGFGADLGAEKFFDIVCPEGDLRPSAAVVVATVRALKMHGGVARADLARPDPGAVERGAANLARHLENLRLFGVPAVVALNRFEGDDEEEIQALRRCCRVLGNELVLCTHWADGGAGAEPLAEAVLAIIDANGGEHSFHPLYGRDLSLWDKIGAIATKIYRARHVVADDKVRREIARYEEAGYGHFPVCIAKTQYSFSTDPRLVGAPEGHEVAVREVRLNAGAGFIVAICGDIMTMPGLPRHPAAEAIDLGADGRITGLF
ncbi:MAG: formate--tetrahydrofolate ligase [Rhodothalassiaceae bacterium]